jgi:hypothetical protein
MREKTEKIHQKSPHPNFQERTEGNIWFVNQATWVLTGDLAVILTAAGSERILVVPDGMLEY